jgi:phospholipase/lecithinase/hemolysin
MILRSRHLFASLSVLAAALVSVPAYAQYDKIVAFGDSLTDNGNLFAATTAFLGPGNGIPKSPYYQGRFSNGPVWVETLAADLGVPLDDFAYGSATTGTVNNASPLLPGMATEVSNYLALPGNTTLDPHALYVLWGGANDYFGGQTNPNVVVGNLTSEITSLASQGATHFFIPNLPLLGELPGTSGNPAISAGLNGLTLENNALLEAALQELGASQPSLSLTYFDVNHYFEAALADPGLYGLTNTTTNYISNQGQPEGTDPEINPALGNNPPPPTGFLFWDEVHPTATWHAILGNLAFATITAPEPTSMAFLLFGVAGVVIRRRKK